MLHRPFMFDVCFEQFCVETTTFFIEENKSTSMSLIIKNIKGPI